MPKPLTIIFCGTPAFAVPSLQALAHDDRFRVTLVISQPDKPVGRKQLLTPPPVKVEADQLGIPVFQPKNLNTEWKAYADTRKIDRPDFLVVVAFGQIVSDEVLQWPNIAPVNIHASLLPKHRGASPIQQAILNGDTETGVTIQRMVKELDAGPVLAKASTPIEPADTTPTLFDRLSKIGATLLIDTLSAPLHESPQDDAQATFCKKLTRADGAIDPLTMTAAEIDRKIRALVPWPGVAWNGVKILKAGFTPHDDAYPLACAGSTTLHVMEVQPAGKKPMTGASWARGRKPDRLP